MNQYVQSILLADRVHRLFLDNVKCELQRLNFQDITHTQAVLLYNIGRESMMVGDLISRKYYLGSNVNYSLRSMVETGYVKQTRSDFDKRSVFVSLTEKGLKLFDELECAFQRYLKTDKNTELTSFTAIVRDMEQQLIAQNKA
jgi:DNA-binding MarR family transcriptional regulator